MNHILLNCDMGESFGAWRMGRDEEVMPFIDCANIACGFHASDPGTMRRTVQLAVAHGVRIGAHPAYPDLVGFGRRSMNCSAQEVQDMLLYQIGALEGICRAEGTRVSYVKPHGALYNDMMRRPELLEAVLQAVHQFDSNLPVMLLARRDNSEALQLARTAEVSLLFEAFADRAYDEEGLLISRDRAGAVHHDPQRIFEQAVTLAQRRPLRTGKGTELQLQADTLCVHGDNPESVALVKRIAEALRGA